MPTNTLPRDPALQTPTPAPVAPNGAPPASPESPAAPVPPAQSSRRQPAPNRPQSAESAVPPTPSPAAPAASSAPLLYTDAQGRVTSVAPSREAEFLEDCRRAGLAVKRATQYRDAQGRVATVALDRREEFLADAQRAGLAVTELTPDAPEAAPPGGPTGPTDPSRPSGPSPAAPADLARDLAQLGLIPDDPRLLALRDAPKTFDPTRLPPAPGPTLQNAPAPGEAPWPTPETERTLPDRLGDAMRDTATVGKRAVVNLAEGAVAIPTLAALGAETLLAKTGAIDEGSHPVSALGIRAIGAMEEAKAERLPYTFERDPARRDASGASEAVASGGELITEILLANAATKGLAALAKRAATQTAAQGAQAAAPVATAAEKRALDAALKATAPAADATPQAARAYAADLSKNYARAFTRESLAEGAKHFAKSAARPTFWKLSIPSRGGLETYQAARQNGDTDATAAAEAYADAALAYLLLGLGDGAGAFMNPAQATAATQFVRALGKGSAHPNLRAELAGTALRIFGGGASAGASAYSHLSFLQANDAPVTDEDKLAQTLASALFGAISGGASSIRPIRRAIMADKELARFRAAIPQPPPQPGPGQSPAAPTPPVLPPGPAATPPNQPGRGAAPHQPNQASRAGETRQTFHGQPQSLPSSGGEAASPAWASVDRLLPTGDVLFRDGSRYRPDTGDYLMPNGAVVSPDGTLLTVAGPDAPTPPSAAPNGAPDSRSTIPDSPGGQSPASPAAPVRALSLYRLLQASDAQVHNVPLADIQVNVDVKQFKSGADPNTGVVAGEELHGEFQKIPAKPIVVFQGLDGSLEVVTGRHRLDLAKRNGLETIPANIIREADGWTPESAALLDAFDNILDEKGSYADYVPFFRKAGIPRDVAQAYGLLARPKGRLSFEIAMNGTDDLVSFVAAGDKRVTPDVAAAICRAVPVPASAREAGVLTGQAARYDAIQHYVIRAVIDEGLRADQAEIMANGIRAEYAKRAEANTIRQDDLFGADETFNTEMALRAKYAGDQLAKINLDLRALKIVSGKQSGNVAAKDSLLKKYNIKGPDDAPGIERAVQELETLHHRWQHYYTDPDLAKEADAFVKKSLRLDPEDQPPIPLDPKGNPITPESAPVSAAEQPPTRSATADELPLGNAASDARQGVPESPASPESPAPSGEAAPAQPLPEVPHESSDEQVNGTGFQALRQGEGFETIKLDLGKRTKESFVNKTLNVSSTIGSAHNASRLTVANRTGGEDANAHRYAAKNVKALYENARIAVRHLDKNHVGQRGKNAPHYLRLFSPFVYEGNLYVAIISQRDVDNQSPGVHAIEALEVLKAEDASAFTSWPDRDTVRSSLTDASSRGKDESRLTEDKIAYTIDESKLDPRHLDGTAYSEAELMRDIRADLADFLARARYRAEHKLQPIDADDVGRFTMGEGVTIEVSDNTATVAGLAAKSPDEAAKLLDAIQAQLPPGVAIAAADRPAPAIQAAIQAHNEAARTQRVWEVLDKYDKVTYRFEDGKHILTFPEKNTRTYQENAAIVKAVKAILPENTPLTLENTKSRLLRALAGHTANTAAPDRRPEGAPPASPASPESPEQPAAGGSAASREDAAIPDTPKAQRDAVRSRHQGRASWLKAPNGKRSNLPKNLWVDVRTPNFKRFFGDWENHPETIPPKLLDENGEPRIFWHYSATPGIRAFDPTRSRAAMDIQGTYFSPDRQDAAGYGQNAYPVFIALKHPADQATAYAGFTPGSTSDAGARRAQELRDQGYDGVIIEDSDAPSGIAEVIVLDPNAIKSAGSNSGAYDPSTPDILANQAPTTQAPSPTPVAPTGAPPFSVLRSPFSGNGIDAVSIAVYPNGGRVPVAGSPAAAAGTLPLSLPHAVQLFHLLTGKLPGIVAQKNLGPRNALGWYLPKTADIFVRAQLFGLIDQSDLTVLKDALTKRGFFRHENPAWCATQTKDSIRREKNLSNQKLEKAADLLIRRRTRAGVHQGAAAKVMAHELWHAISASGGVPPRDHGNLLGQIYNLKKCMAKALPENAFATDDVLRQEAKDFIAWWRGTGEHEPYFDQPHEAYAEMGAAFFLDPEAVKERAPTYYNAMLDGLRNYPQAFDALAAIRDQHAAGGDLDAFQRRLQATWQAAHDARLRKLRDEVGKPTRDERKARIVQLLWNRHAPVMMILQRAQETVRARLHKDLKEGNITQADHDARIRELDEEQLDLRHHTLLFTHRHGPSKAFLADIWGKIGQRAKELDVSMNDLNLYLHLRRVEELKGRATALGIDPPTARLMLNKFFDRLGYSKVRAIARLAKTFYATWQHAILENPDVIAMLGPQKIAELKQNAHYITMRHVPTPEELQAATVAWENTKQAKPGGDPLDPIVRELLGHKAYTSGIYGATAQSGVASALKRLQGSLRQTESPLTATAETGLTILEAAQRNALAISLVRTLKAVGFDEIAVLKPTDDVITNDRFGTVQYMENGKRVTLAAPRSVVDALSGAPHEIPYLTAATRFLSAGFTTNNPAFIIPAALRDLDSLYLQMPGMKRGFAQWCAAYANIIPGIGPLRFLRAAVNLGNWVNWSAQFIPPHVMKRISQTPIGRLLYGQKTVGYWTSVGARIARIIQNMDFEGTLREAQEARLAGNTDKAEALEYCVTMARHALEDGVLLTYNQQLADDYLKGGLQRLFDKYHLKYDDDRRHLPIPAKIAKRAQDYRDTLRQRLQHANAVTDPKKRMAALAAVAASPAADLPRSLLVGLWESAGFLSEYQSMMVKLAGWAYLHHESAAGTLPPLPTDPTGNTASQGATPVARQGAPFSVLRSPFSGGGEAASSGAYDASRRRQIALYAADRAGDPNFANKGILLGQLETFFTGFLNACMKGLSRTAARLKEAPGEFSLKALALLAPSLLGYLLYDGTLKRAVQTLFFDGQEPDDEQLNTLAGNLYTTLAWEQDALKNVSPYTRLNYFTTPLWMSADKSVTLTLKTPIPEEIKPLHYALTALLNRTTLDTGIPNVGLNDALAEIYGNLAPGSGDRGVAIALLDTWAAPWLSGDNPWQSYRNANQFSDDAFRARYLTPMPLIKEQLIDTWNGSPLVALSRLRRNDQYGDVPQDLQALHTLLQTPIVGPVLARFASIDSNGRAQTVSQYTQIAEARKAALRIQAKDTAKTYLQTNTLPDTLKTLPPEEQLYFIDALLDAVKDQALPKSTSTETLRKALNIPFQDLRQPALRATQSNP